MHPPLGTRSASPPSRSSAALRLAAVVAEARLQEAVTGPARATVGSVAGVGGELAALPLFLVWGLGGLPAVSVAVIVAGLVAGSLMARAIRR